MNSLRGLLLLLVLRFAVSFVPITTKASQVRVTASPWTSPSSYHAGAPQQTVTIQGVNNPSSSRISMAAAAAAEATDGDDDGATIPQLIFNLVKGIVGAGVLSLPVGISAWGNAPSAVLPAALLIAGVGALSGYCFAMIGRVCSYTDTTSYRDAWSATVNESTSWMPAVAVTFKTFCAILAYSMILGDTFVSLLATAGYTAAKTPVLLGITGAVLLPLCLLKNLASLAPFSLVGSLGMIYTAVAMTMRYLGKSYAAGGKLVADCPKALQPAFGTVGAKGILTPNAAILLGMLSTAYMAHFNAPKFYMELKNKTLPRYFKVVSTSFAISISIFALIASMGFLTFGSASSGMILNNYSTRDTLMGLSRIAVAVSLVFSYPLAFVGFRDGVFDLLKLKKSATRENGLTVALLSLVTWAALVIPDVSFVMALGGATLGNSLIYIFPALMFRGAIKDKKDATPAQKREVKFALGGAAFGLVMGILGATKAIQSVL